MRILVLGGTRFIGRHVITQALQRGHEVTLLSRGRTPSPFGGNARHVLTDRRNPTKEALQVLAEAWDAVVDTCAADIDDLRATTPLLRGNAGSYLMLSSCGVYRPSRTRLTENAATIPTDQIDSAHAPANRKLRCERYLARQIRRAGGRMLIARLGVVVGRYDYNQRLAYWLERSLRGGQALVPMDRTQPLQLIDADDTARFLLDLLSSTVDGVVNVAGPCHAAVEVIDTIVDCSGGHAVPQWVSEDFALRHELRPWTQVPLWLPRSTPERALMNVDSALAISAGLAYRPLADTIADCLAWQSERRGWSPKWLSPARERELLNDWQG